MDEGGENTKADEDGLRAKIEIEKEKLQSEFNAQRAKMKELFLQKEDELSKKTNENLRLKGEVEQVKRELDDVKSQLVVAGLTLESNLQVEKRKAEEEIASLQQIVHETVEESSSSKSLYDSELKRLQVYIHQLENEITELRQSKQQSPHHTVQEHSSLAPSVVLNALTKGIVKKLSADPFTQEDESTKKTVTDHAEEDPEVLRSLVGPLEDQIKALKEKLRYTDEQLQKCRECGHFKDSETILVTGDGTQTVATCDMCKNYEMQLVNEQKRGAELEGKILAAEKAVERHKEELQKEINFRKNMEVEWNEKNEEHKQEVAELTTRLGCAENDLKELEQYFRQTYTELHEVLKELTSDREKVYQELTKLQNENDNLVGKYTIHSRDLQSQDINLPNTVEELHELVLHNQQDLITAKIGKEAAEERINSLQSDILLLKDQLTQEEHEKTSLENRLVQEISVLSSKITQMEKEKETHLAHFSKLQNSHKTNLGKMTEMQELIQKLEAENKRYTDICNELKTRAASLQQELDNSEAVQKDFVLLSQSLQVELEKIRDSDSQVRWQFDEDVDECPSCHSGFANPRQKLHCMHCGRIFCPSCLTRSVNSGPNMRPAKVCDVCHTLLVRSSAPYFSKAPPLT